MAGEDISHGQADKTCNAVTKNKDLSDLVEFAYDKVTRLVPDEVANPCGLVAKSFFTDTYKLYDANNQQIPIK